MSRITSHKPFRLWAAALALALVGFGATPALAVAVGDDPSVVVDGVSQEAPNPTTVNTAATVQLQIHKMLDRPPSDIAADGREQAIAGIKLDGVNFDVYQVYTDSAKTTPLKMDTVTVQRDAAEITKHKFTAAEVKAGSFEVDGVTYFLGTKDTVTTGGGDGTATFKKKNGVGVYVVAENLETSTSITANPAKPGLTKDNVTPSAPFAVALPMTDETGSAWMYNVHVYPKNQSDEMTKEVKDLGTVTAEGGNVGEHDIVYTLKSTITPGIFIPQGIDELFEQAADRARDEVGKYEIYDDLDERLTLKQVTVALKEDLRRCNTEDINSVTCDYLVYADDHFQPTDAEVPGGPVVKIKMTNWGLGAVYAWGQDYGYDAVHTTITATVNEEKDGVISNNASFIPNKRWEDSHPNLPGILSNEVKSYYGDLKITKTGEDDAPLPGASFSVYHDANDDGKCTRADDIDGKKAINSAESTTDGNKAALTIKGLLASNWYDGEEQPESRGYCFVETAAPEGYVVKDTPVYFTIDYKTAAQGNAAFYATTVKNDKNPKFRLPLTGAQGTYAAFGLGIAFILIGAAIYRVSSRRKTK